tara:strand:- start:649 stop:927 length:279 start_codon:yes stop_codon:yes gene_type:complete
MTDDRIEALESKVESLLRNTSPNIADSVKEIFERLNALEEAEKARLDAEHEEYEELQDEYDDDDYEDDDPEDDDDDESDKHCPSCTCNEPDK